MNIGKMGLSAESIRRFKRTMQYLQLTPQQRQKIMQTVLWRLKDKAKKNVSHQQSPEGGSWQPRKKKLKGGKLKNKMLRKCAVLLDTKIEEQGEQGRLHYTKSETARISAIHQQGLNVENVQTEKDKRQLEKLLAQNREKATPKQIKRLRELGYSVYSEKRTKDGKLKRRKAKRKDIAQMTRAQAGLLIKILKTKQGIDEKQGGESYKMPARPFLDENEQRNAEIVTAELIKVFEQATKA